MTTGDWRDLIWVGMAAAVGLAVLALVTLSGACEDPCPVSDRDHCMGLWSTCAADGGDLGDCTAAYCACLETRGCMGTCDWVRACDGIDTDGGI